MKPLSDKQLNWQISSMLDHAIESNEKGEKLPWHKPWSNMKGGNCAGLCAFNMVTGRQYSFINQMFLPAGGYITLNAAKKEGLRIQQEQFKNTYVAHSIFPTSFHDPEKTDPKSWGQKITPVYHLSQLEEESQKSAMDKFLALQNNAKVLPDNDVKTVEIEQTLIDKYITRYCDKLNGGISYGSNKAYYVPANDSISVPSKEQFKNIAEYYCTVLHEITHSTGHISRCNRPMSGRFGSAEYALEELVAELGASALCRLLGVDYMGGHIDSEQNSKAYLTGWLKKCKASMDKNTTVVNVHCAVNCFQDVIGVDLKK